MVSPDHESPQLTASDFANPTTNNYTPLFRLLVLHEAACTDMQRDDDLQITFVGAYALSDPGFLSPESYELLFIAQYLDERARNFGGFLSGEMHTKDRTYDLNGEISESHINIKTPKKPKKTELEGYLRELMNLDSKKIADPKNMTFEGQTFDSGPVYHGNFYSNSLRGLTGKKELLLVPTTSLYDPGLSIDLGAIARNMHKILSADGQYRMMASSSGTIDEALG